MITLNSNVAKIAQIALLSIPLITLTGCQNSMDNEAAGTIVGGLAGGLLGGQIGNGTGQVLATVGGALAGAVIGNAIGHNMDKVDQMKFNQALENGRSNKATTWTNPDENVTYAVTPKPAKVANNGQPCREYTFDAIIGGRTKQVYGTACRDAAGDWKIMN